MIKNFSDHAANERTFLAWLRTGLSIAAFGFVIEKFNLFLAVAAQPGHQRPPPGWVARIGAPFGRYDGIVLILIGIVIMILGGIRFVRITRQIDRAEMYPAGGVRLELLLSFALALLAAGFCVYATLG